MIDFYSKLLRCLLVLQATVYLTLQALYPQGKRIHRGVILTFMATNRFIPLFNHPHMDSKTIFTHRHIHHVLPPNLINHTEVDTPRIPNTPHQIVLGRHLLSLPRFISLAQCHLAILTLYILLEMLTAHLGKPIIHNNRTFSRNPRCSHSCLVKLS